LGEIKGSFFLEEDKLEVAELELISLVAFSVKSPQRQPVANTVTRILPAGILSLPIPKIMRASLWIRFATLVKILFTSRSFKSFCATMFNNKPRALSMV